MLLTWKAHTPSPVVTGTLPVQAGNRWGANEAAEYATRSGIVACSEGANKPCWACKIFPQTAPYSLYTPSEMHLLGLNYTHPLCNPSERCKSYKSALLQQRIYSSAKAGVSRGHSAHLHHSSTGEPTCEHQIHLGLTWWATDNGKANSVNTQATIKGLSRFLSSSELHLHKFTCHTWG